MHDRAWIAGVLRAGLSVGGVLVTVGFVFALLEGLHVSEAVRPAEILSRGTIADRLMASGMLVLGATPIAGVVALVVRFVRARDVRFAALALAVLGILGAGVFLGHG